MTTAIIYRASSGVPGDVSRPDDAMVEPAFMGTDVTAYGAPVKFVTNKIAPIGASDAASVFAGVLIRRVPEISGNALQGFLDAIPNPDQMQDVIRRGYVLVACPVGTPVRGGAVYLRVVADTGKAVGDFEATSDVAATGAASGGNTGNGTIGTVSATQSAQSGVYTATMLTATTFNVVAPNGDLLKSGATGAAYTADGVTFTITVGGTPMVAGDSFTITVAKKNVLLTNAEWSVGGKDSSNVTELRLFGTKAA